MRYTFGSFSENNNTKGIIPHHTHTHAQKKNPQNKIQKKERNKTKKDSNTHKKL